MSNPQEESIDEAGPYQAVYQDAPPSYAYVVTDNDLHYEARRRATFRRCNHGYTAELMDKLALNGFYYSHETDELTCFSCSLTLPKWDPSDDPMITHQTYRDCSLYSNWDYLPPAVPCNVPIDADKFQQLMGWGRITRPRYVSFLDRIKSFANWPPAIKQKPSELSAAGLYYTGMGDRVICFQCGQGIRHWEKNDVPYIEHYRCSPMCHFARQCYELQTNLKQGIKPGIPTDDAECNICYTNKINCAFIPCGHAFCCFDCSISCKNVCPVCRKDSYSYHLYLQKE